MPLWQYVINENYQENKRGSESTQQELQDLNYDFNHRLRE